MKVQKIIFGGLIGVFLFVGLACQPASQETASVETATPTPTPAEKLDDFEERLRGVQTANFDYVFAFRRKDGGEFDKEDKRFVKQNAPAATNQWVLTRDNKVVIAGSNYKFAPEKLESLKNRFNVEDYSNIVEDSNTNVNVNAANNSKTNNNKNTNKGK